MLATAIPKQPSTRSMSHRKSAAPLPPPPVDDVSAPVLVLDPVSEVDAEDPVVVAVLEAAMPKVPPAVELGATFSFALSAALANWSMVSSPLLLTWH